MAWELQKMATRFVRFDGVGTGRRPLWLAVHTITAVEVRDTLNYDHVVRAYTVDGQSHDLSSHDTRDAAIAALDDAMKRIAGEVST